MSDQIAPLRPDVPKRHLTVPVPVHDQLTAQTRLFLLLVRPHYTFARLAEEHLQLIADLEREGPDVLRRHLRASAGALVDGVLHDKVVAQRTSG